MNKKKQNFVCTFDSSHKVESEQKLILHMKKCKSQQKQSYECCKYNPLHWVKYNQIEEHEKQCILTIPSKSMQQKAENVLPNQISRFEMEIPFEIDMTMIQSRTQKNIVQSGKNDTKENNRKMKKNENKIEVEKKPTFWIEPDFTKFLQVKGYKSKQQKANIPNHQVFDSINQTIFF